MNSSDTKDATGTDNDTPRRIDISSSFQMEHSREDESKPQNATSPQLQNEESWFNEVNADDKAATPSSDANVAEPKPTIDNDSRNIGNETDTRDRIVERARMDRINTLYGGRYNERFVTRIRLFRSVCSTSKYSG